MVERLDAYVERRWPGTPVEEVEVRDRFVDGKHRWFAIRRTPGVWGYEDLGLLDEGARPVFAGGYSYILGPGAPAVPFKKVDSFGRVMAEREFHPLQAQAINERNSAHDSRYKYPSPQWIPAEEVA